MLDYIALPQTISRQQQGGGSSGGANTEEAKAGVREVLEHCFPFCQEIFKLL